MTEVASTLTVRGRSDIMKASMLVQAEIDCGCAAGWMRTPVIAPDAAPLPQTGLTEASKVAPLSAISRPVTARCRPVVALVLAAAEIWPASFPVCTGEPAGCCRHGSAGAEHALDGVKGCR